MCSYKEFELLLVMKVINKNILIIKIIIYTILFKIIVEINFLEFLS